MVGFPLTANRNRSMSIRSNTLVVAVCLAGLLADGALLNVDLPGRSVVAEELSTEAKTGAEFSAADWPWWRGPTRNGVASSQQDPPLEWSDSSHVAWKTAIPGRGHGSVTVVGDEVVFAVADHEENVQAVYCLGRDTGKLRWRTPVHQGGLSTKGNKKATQASTTVACDGERYFVNFLNGGAVYTSALDRAGKILWQTKVTDYTVHQGFGASPAPYGPLVLVSADNKGGGAVAGLNRSSGEIVWKNSRPKKPNYASPIVLRVNGKDQLIFTGCDLVTSLEPLTGKTLWEVEGATTECVTSPVTDGKHVFTSGGYPRNHVAAIRGDGSGEVAWDNNTRVYVPSMVVKDGFLYAVADAGIAICYRADSGKVVWKDRIQGVFTSSPILAGSRIYATNEAGRTYVFEADPKAFRLLAENQLGDECFATPSICGSQIFTRVAERMDGKRQEYIYCLSK